MTTTHQDTRHDDDLDTPLWGVKEMAPVINRTERETYHLIKIKQLDVTRKGALYVSTKRRLLASLGVLRATTSATERDGGADGNTDSVPLKGAAKRNASAA